MYLKLIELSIKLRNSLTLTFFNNSGWQCARKKLIICSAVIPLVRASLTLVLVRLHTTMLGNLKYINDKFHYSVHK